MEKIIEQVNEMRDKVEAVQRGMEVLSETGFRKEILYLLIQKNSQRFTQLRNNNIKISDVKAIVCGIETLHSYMFPKPEENDTLRHKETS